MVCLDQTAEYLNPYTASSIPHGTASAYRSGRADAHAVSSWCPPRIKAFQVGTALRRKITLDSFSLCFVYLPTKYSTAINYSSTQRQGS